MADQNGLIGGADPQADGQPTGNPYLDSLIWGAKWDFTNEPTIDYYFEGAGNGTQAFKAEEKAAFRQILDNFEAVCNVTFTEVFSEAASDITWVKVPNDPDFVAYHDVPDGMFPDPAYGIFTTSDGGWSNVDEQGSFFYNIVQHEIGHGMGLAHPHDGGDQDDATTFPGVTKNADADKGDNNLNQGIWTVMSYNSGWDQAPGVNAFGTGPSYGWAGTLMAFDIAALQYLYGVNNTYKTGDDDYVLPTANAKGTFWSCIWDAGGIDTISNEGKAGAATINLNDAPLVGPNAGGYVSRVAGIKGGFTIANGAMIENGIGGDGNDYIVGNELDNVLDGNGGIDTVSYELAAAGVTVDLNIQDGTTEQDTVGAGQDTLSEFENLVGSAFGDTLIGDGNVNKIEGGAGDDLILGGAKNDALDGAAGADTADYSYLAAGNNLTITLGTLTVSTGSVAQTSTSGVAGDVDTLKNFEHLIGGAGDDKFTGNAGANSLFGRDGDDLLIGGFGSDTLDGGAHNALGDTASFAGITTAVTASLVIGTGEYLKGAVKEIDTFIDIENLTGGSGADQLTGDAGVNILNGVAGNDKLFGGDGNDTLIGGAGADEIDGEGDTDTASYAASTAGVTVVLDGVTLGKGGEAAGDKLSNVENLIGSAFSDRLTGNAGVNVITGGAGNDTLDGAGGDDELFGGDGNDTFVGGAGADKFDGGAGINTASYATAAAGVTVAANGAGFGSDAEGDALTNVQNLTGSDHNDNLSGDGAINVLLGGKGDDTLFDGTSGDGADTLTGGEGNDLITGFAGDKLDGGLGDDTLTALYGVLGGIATANLTTNIFTAGAAKSTLAGFEHLIGDDANNVFTGSALANKLTGGNGDDTIEGMAGADILDGEGSNIASANDTVGYAASNLAVTIDLNQQGTTVIADDAIAQTGGHAQGDKLYGFENVIGSKFADMLTGDGNSNIIEGGLGNDVLDGGAEGAGGDTVSFASATAAVTFSLAAQDNAIAQKTGGAGTDIIFNFENILGGKVNDKLSGDAGKNSIDGGAGNDIIDGGEDEDRLFGGFGIDTISYALSLLGVMIFLLEQGTFDAFGSPIDGDAQTGGDAQGDLLWGFENITGSAFADTLEGDGVANTILGGGGDDKISGLGGKDVLDGGAGIDTADFSYLTAGQNLALTLGTLTVATGAVAKTSTTGVAGDTDSVMNFENVTGGAGNDKLTGNAGANVFDGGAGNDMLFGMAGDDTLVGGDGDDVLEGGLGDDTLDGGADDDTASYAAATTGVSVDLTKQGTPQNTVGAGADTLDNIENLTGSAKNDTLIGDGGDNVIEGRLGDDILEGGGGTDTLSYAGATAAVTASLALQGGQQATGGGGKDTANGFVNLWGGSGADKLTGDDAANEIRGGAGNDIIDGGKNDDTLFGDAGDDTLNGGEGSDTFFGGAGKDKINGGDGADLARISGTDGVGDVYDLGGNVFDAIEFFGSTPIALSNFNATTASIEILNANGFDVTGTTGADNIDFSGFDTVNGLGTIDGLAGNDKITGTLNADTIFGGTGSDILNGFDGDDHLYGGAGTDTLTGGDGADTFHIKWGEGADTIKDFATTVDEIEIDLLPTQFDPTQLLSGAGITPHTGPDPALIYNQTDGKLYYDAGPGSAVLITTLTGAPALAFSDFIFT